MSYENPQQKRLLEQAQNIASKCSAAGIAYGKFIATVNIGYGRNRSISEELREKRAEMRRQVKEQNQLSAKRAAAFTLARMTGEQVRLSRKLPDDMLAQVADDQMVGEVFSLDQLEAIL